MHVVGKIFDLAEGLYLLRLFLLVLYKASIQESSAKPKVIIFFSIFRDDASGEQRTLWQSPIFCGHLPVLAVAITIVLGANLLLWLEVLLL